MYLVPAGRHIYKIVPTKVKNQRTIKLNHYYKIALVSAAPLGLNTKYNYFSINISPRWG